MTSSRKGWLATSQRIPRGSPCRRSAAPCNSTAPAPEASNPMAANGKSRALAATSANIPPSTIAPIPSNRARRSTRTRLSSGRSGGCCMEGLSFLCERRTSSLFVRTPTTPKSFPFRLEFPPELPISVRAEEITAAIQAHQVVILAGETGSGKTTQIPKMCLAAGRGSQGRIACTQPRRVAALSISRRVAEELGVAWGREVGCKIRFNDQTTPQTVIKFLTDGMLLAEVQGDPMLRDYDTIILDEAHERSLNIDFLLGHLRTLRYRRPELKVIITSATIDTAAFSEAFDGAPVVLVEGRTFPVEVIYAPLDELGRDYSDNDENEEKDDPSAVASARAEALHYIDGAVEAIERIVRESTSGDALVFLPSERDIREVRDLLEGRRLREVELVPLFGRLSNAEQQ